MVKGEWWCGAAGLESLLNGDAPAEEPNDWLKPGGGVGPLHAAKLSALLHFPHHFVER
jgi:hypothetical protein